MCLGVRVSLDADVSLCLGVCLGMSVCVCERVSDLSGYEHVSLCRYKHVSGCECVCVYEHIWV